MDDKNKAILKAAEALAKYTKVEPGADGKVKGKGKLFQGNKLTKGEYIRSMQGLFNQVSRLEIDQARRMSHYVLDKRPDAASLIDTIRGTALSVEKETSSGRTIDPLRPDSPGVANVCMMETNSKLDKLTAIFSGRGLEEAYTDELQARQCEDIESLLQGREVSQKKREVGQHEELEQLTNLLAGALAPSRGSQHSLAGTAVNTARGTGPTQPFPTLGGMHPPTTARKVDIRPKCLTARAPADPNQEGPGLDLEGSVPPMAGIPPQAGPSGQGAPNWGGQTQVAGPQMPAAPGPTQISVGGP